MTTPLPKLVRDRIPHLIAAATVGLLLSDAGVLPRLLGIPPEAWAPWVGGPLWGAAIFPSYRRLTA